MEQEQKQNTTSKLKTPSKGLNHVQTGSEQSRWTFGETTRKDNDLRPPPKPWNGEENNHEPPDIPQKGENASCEAISSIHLVPHGDIPSSSKPDDRMRINRPVLKRHDYNKTTALDHCAAANNCDATNHVSLAQGIKILHKLDHKLQEVFQHTHSPLASNQLNHHISADQDRVNTQVDYRNRPLKLDLDLEKHHMGKKISYLNEDTQDDTDTEAEIHLKSAKKKQPSSERIPTGSVETGLPATGYPEFIVPTRQLDVCQDTIKRVCLRIRDKTETMKNVKFNVSCSGNDHESAVEELVQEELVKEEDFPRVLEALSWFLKQADTCSIKFELVNQRSNKIYQAELSIVDTSVLSPS